MSRWRGSQAVFVHGRVWACPAWGSHIMVAQLIFSPCEAAMHTCVCMCVSLKFIDCVCCICSPAQQTPESLEPRRQAAKSMAVPIELAEMEGGQSTWGAASPLPIPPRCLWRLNPRAPRSKILDPPLPHRHVHVTAADTAVKARTVYDVKDGTRAGPFQSAFIFAEMVTLSEEQVPTRHSVYLLDSIRNRWTFTVRSVKEACVS